MGNAGALLVLALSAACEAGGDALLRTGLHSTSMAARMAWMLLGGLSLFAYGVTVNLPPWDFGRLLGVYVVLFFLVAQLINAVAFDQMPTVPILVGGTFIVAGGLIISFGTGLSHSW
jgi:small multidrug resistance family-3 protein